MKKHISSKIYTKSNYQDLLKILALISMLIDYLGLYIFREEILFRIIGKFAMPIFAFYVGYNFRNKVKHNLWIYGAIIMIAEYIVFNTYTPNILITLALGQLYLLYAGEAILNNNTRYFKHFLAMIILAYGSYDVVNYGTLAIAFIQIGYLKANGQKDPGYLLFLTLIYAIVNQYIYQFNTIFHFFLALFIVLFAAILLGFVNHDKSIKIDLRPISRNSFYIYTITILIFLSCKYIVKL